MRHSLGICATDVVLCKGACSRAAKASDTKSTLLFGFNSNAVGGSRVRRDDSLVYGDGCLNRCVSANSRAVGASIVALPSTATVGKNPELEADTGFLFSRVFARTLALRLNIGFIQATNFCALRDGSVCTIANDHVANVSRTQTRLANAFRIGDTKNKGRFRALCIAVSDQLVRRHRRFLKRAQRCVAALLCVL